MIDLPDGYDIRHVPPRAGVMGARDTWYITYKGDAAFRVFDLARLPGELAKHQAAGSPTTPARKTRAQQLHDAVRADAAAGMTVEVIARRHRLDVEGVLGILRAQSPRPRFVEVERTMPGPVRRRVPRSSQQVRFTSEA